MYLDIDGVILTEEKGGDERIRPGVAEFLTWATAHMEVILLTCWQEKEIRGKLAPRLEALGVSTGDIGVAPWGVLKTDAMDFSRTWFRVDDHVEPAEWTVVEGHGAADRMIVVDATDDEQLARAFDRVRVGVEIEVRGGVEGHARTAVALG